MAEETRYMKVQKRLQERMGTWKTQVGQDHIEEVSRGWLGVLQAGM
jgi:hypothetical protein